MENLSLRNLFKKKTIISLATIFIPALLFLAVMLLIAVKTGIRFSTFSRDPLQLLNGKPYVGLISSTGIIFWCATAGILFFAWRLSIRQKKPERQTSFLFYSGLLTLLMLIDDIFLMHDVIFPEILKINELAFFLFYGLAVISIFIRYYKLILNTDYILLILSFGLLGLSAMTDEILALGFRLERPFIIEDGFKFLGLIAWISYFIRTSFSFIKPVDNPEKS